MTRCFPRSLPGGRAGTLPREVKTGLISFRKYRKGSQEDHSGELVEALRVLLEGIKAQCTAVDQSGGRLPEDLERLADGVRRQSPTDILAAAGVVATTMEESGDRAARSMQARWREIQRAVAMSAHALAVAPAACEGHLKRLREMEQQLQEAAGLTDPADVQTRVAECLQELQNETRRQQEQLEQKLADIRTQRQRLERIGAQMHLGPAADRATGLEGRDAAEQALAEGIERRGNLRAAIFHVERVQLINARFGYATGDQVLLTFSHHLAGLLPPEDRLFRWTGPVFVVLMERTGSREQIQLELEKISSAKLEIAVQIGNGCVLIPVTSGSALFSLLDVGSVFELARNIDALVHEQSQRK